MYEISWNSTGDGMFSHCSVTPIHVTREGILPGCSATTIDFTDHTGRKCQGTASNYHDTEAQAWAEIHDTINKAIINNEASIKKMTDETKLLYEYLKIVNERKA